MLRHTVTMHPVTDHNWHVLIFEGVGSYRGRGLTHTIPVNGDYRAALAHAARMAAEYQPTHPVVPQRRQIFHTPPDSWIVNVHGATRSFHFTVQVANLVAG